MSTHPGVTVPCRRVSVAGPILTLCSLLVLAACDRPESPEAITAPQFTSHTTVACDDFNTGGTTKTLTLTVKLSTNATKAGIVVTMIHPDEGPVCSAVTNSSGEVRFSQLSRSEKFFVSIRDEVSEHAPAVEIGPADPNTIALNLLEDTNGPSLPMTRQMPTLLSGNSCTKTTLSWSDFSDVNDAPCVVPTTGSPNFSVNVRLADTPKILVNVVDPNGAVSGPVLIAAISTPGQNAVDPCGKMPWLDPLTCNDADEFSGPGLLQAMTVTYNGELELGVHVGSSPLYIEATAPRDGFTLFGTLVIPPAPAGIQASVVPSYSVFLAPGMCSITEITDQSEPSGSSELDIQSGSHSIGMQTQTAAADPLAPMELKAVPSTIVIQTIIHAINPGGGTGALDLQYRGASGPGNLGVRIPFSIVDGECTTFAATGTGVGGGVEAVGYCTQTGTTAAGRGVFTLYFTLTNVLDLVAAEYRINAAKDHLDPSRSDGQSDDVNISRGRIQITTEELQQTKCAVPTNNDGRWLIV